MAGKAQLFAYDGQARHRHNAELHSYNHGAQNHAATACVGAHSHTIECECINAIANMLQQAVTQ